ncbi:glycosyltransferase family 2 protein [Synechococcus sp. CBW1107]|uniref:glycosyltransferase family 2 protein n=1 Tax=Synechococcus sp. CBW1107 TaxID=2789857 RepID=UPI002AD3C8E8|nr:glycosyltransferase family 2 protein [Synechococcus sp. CBW1107]
MSTIKYWVSPLSKKQSRWLRLSAIPWAACMIMFAIWWFNPVHQISLLGSLLGSALFLYEALTPGYFYNFLRRIKIVNPELQPDPNWRLAIVVTKAPSEPWSMVKNTLEAMLQQDIPHDTWLADEDPSDETLEWCQANHVMVSTRRGVPEYHRKEWPRRTKCKEGNLAYFYDFYGYASYDIVAQLDADHVPAPDYLRNIVIPFHDPSVGYVAAPSICDNNAAESWSARGRLYAEATLHGPLQAGYNDKWAPLCIGSHYCVRTNALKDIGGLGPELAEDHSTTLMMNSKGWNGVFQPNAIAHGDGPASFMDCMIQEYQWSRSLFMILLQWSPKLMRGLTLRKKFQFLFSQVWYSLFSSVAIIGFLIPILCLAIDRPLLRMSYLIFVVFSFSAMLLNLIPATLLKHFKLLRPQDARVISWEYPLFTLTRFPWVLGGILDGFISVITSRDIVFRVTPKGSDRQPRLPLRALSPYLLISLFSSLAVLAFHNNIYTKGYYFLASVSSISLSVAALVVVLIHLQEGGWKAKRSHTVGIISAISALLFAFFSGGIKLKNSLTAVTYTQASDKLGSIR